MLTQASQTFATGHCCCFKMSVIVSHPALCCSLFLLLWYTPCMAKWSSRRKKKSLFSLHFQITTLHWGQIRTGAQVERNWNRSHRGTLITGLVPGSRSASFLYSPFLPTYIGMVPPTVGWPLPHRSSIKKIPLREATNQFFSRERFLFLKWL